MLDSSSVARHLEANGIPTVIMGCAKDIIEHAAVARFLFSDFPLGNSAGKPHDVESQALTLGECDIQVAQATATARCQGNVRFVRTFGSRDPVNAPTGWLFRMRKAGESWTIEDVTGTDAGRN